MIDKTKLVRFIESELDGFKLKVLFKHKQLLNEEKFEEFAKVILKRNKKSFGYLLGFSFCFIAIGVLYISDQLIPGSPLWIGLSYLFIGVLFMVTSTKEYYQVRGSMTLLMYLLEADEEHEPQITSELETV
jgi:hypothetical protein